MSDAAVRELTVEAAMAGERVDKLVGASLGLSRTRVKELFEEGVVYVNGRRARKGQTAEAGQKISVKLVEKSEEPLVAEPEAPLSVLYSDDSLVAVDKPAGKPSHPLQPGEVGTVANALFARFPECREASEDPREAGLCHRLDVGTSGVLLAARNRQDWERVRAAFSAREVDKRYWALVTGPIADEGEIEVPLRHHPRHADRVEPATVGEDTGREALSNFRVLGRSGDYSFVEVRILTGVLHQVRAHLAAIGAPIVGDGLYQGRAESRLSRFFLHARSVGLAHPRTGERLRIESPLPPELSAMLDSLAIRP